MFPFIASQRIQNDPATFPSYVLSVSNIVRGLKIEFLQSREFQNACKAKYGDPEGDTSLCWLSSESSSDDTRVINGRAAGTFL